MSGRKPDYTVSALNKANEQRGPIGVAWKNDDGSISVKLNAFVYVAAAPDLLITLFPKDDGPCKKPSQVPETPP